MKTRKANWKPKPRPPKKRLNSYSREYKIEAIMYWECATVEGTRNRKTKKVGDRKPTYLEVCAFYNNVFSPSTLAGWIHGQEKIFNSKTGAQRVKNWSPKWPELEEELYCLFIGRRTENKLVGRHWFEREARKLWPSVYPESPNFFAFSNSWFQGFRRRYGILFRAITK